MLVQSMRRQQAMRLVSRVIDFRVCILTADDPRLRLLFVLKVVSSSNVYSYSIDSEGSGFAVCRADIKNIMFDANRAYVF